MTFSSFLSLSPPSEPAIIQLSAAKARIRIAMVFMACPFDGQRFRIERMRLAMGLLHLQQFDVEDKRGIGRGGLSGAAGAVAEVAGDDELADAAFLHARDAEVPALDDLAGAELEIKGPAVIEARVELGAVLELADVVHDDGVAGLGLAAGAHLDVDVLKAG